MHKCTTRNTVIIGEVDVWNVLPQIKFCIVNNNLAINPPLAILPPLWHIDK